MVGIDMEIKTHGAISKKLVGAPIKIVDGVRAVAELTATSDMAADSTGLVHGGFAFSLADYAAMLAVNQPNVVLGHAQAKFTAPIRVKETMRAEATVTKTEGRKTEVSVEVKVGDKKVLTGSFTCYTLEKHVLDK
jgi:acyl-coenzyme A thioesterase PaaI-like protein